MMPGEFHFLRPAWLWALLPLGLLWYRLHRSRTNAGAWKNACDAHLLPYLLVVHSGTARLLPLRLLGLGWLVAVLALAGPTWSRQSQPVLQSLQARVIVLSLSPSMLVPDVKPSRLVRARFKVTDILHRSQEGQTGLVVFGGAAFVVVPLTQDTDTIAAVLPVLESALLPVQGNRVELGLGKAMELLQQAGFQRGDILLLADAGNGPATLEAARNLRAQGFRLSVLAVGSEQGAPIPLANGGFLRDAAGSIVAPRLEAADLRELAQAGGGNYAVLSADNSDLEQVLADPAPWDQQFQRSDRETAQWREEGPWLLLLLLPLAALAFRRGWLLLCCVLLLPQPSKALDWADFWQRRDQQAAHALQAGDFDRAARLGDAMQRGIAEYRQGRYEPAVDAFAQAGGADAHYNQGNALAQLGRYQEALAAYDAALAAEPAMEDARFNRALIEELLRRQAQAGRQSQQGETRSTPSANADRSRHAAGTQSTARQSTATTGQAPMGSSQPQDKPPSAKSSNRQPATGGEEPNPQAIIDPAGGGMFSSGMPRQSTDEEALHHSEEQQTLQQWLRRIPDDPGGLWRRKFLYQYRFKGRQSGVAPE